MWTRRLPSIVLTSVALVVTGCQFPGGGSAEMTPLPVAPAAAAAAAPTASPAQSIVFTVPDVATLKVTQKTPVWCWAAAGEIVHRFWGKEIAQEQLAERIHGLIDGKVPEMIATRLEILSALAPDLPPASQVVIERIVTDLAVIGGASALKNREALLVILGKVALDWAKLSMVDWNRTVAELREGVSGRTPPVVVALKPEAGSQTGHVCVLVELEVRKKTGAPGFLGAALGGTLGSFAPDAFELVRARLYDPWDGSTREMKGAELKERADLVLGHAQAVAMLESMATQLGSAAPAADGPGFFDQLFGDD